MPAIVRNSAAAAVVAILGGLSAPASATDDFMQIHMDNQKISSEVSAFWASQRASTSAVQADVPQYYGVPNLLTFRDIQEHFGMVPAFFHLFPEVDLVATWNAYKNVHLNPDTALDVKTKHLIGLAVAAQADCSACIYFQTSAAFANGASFQEVQEAVAVFVIQDNWSKVLTPDTFQTVKDDTNALMSLGTLRAPAPPAVN
jgi:AhpD family alkylhydroperoxidase